MTWRLGEQAGRIFAHVSDGIVVLDQQFRFLHVNPEASRLLRRAPEELYGRTVREAFSHADGGELWDVGHQALSTQEPQTIEAHSQMLEGWFEVRAFPAPEGLTLYFRDVTERRTAERERQRLIARLHSALQRSEQLRELTDALARTMDLQEVGDVVIKHTQAALGCRFAGVALVDHDRQTMRYLTMAPLAEEVARTWSEFPLDVAVPASDTVRGGEPLLFGDRDEILTAYPHISEDLHAAGTEAMANLPLTASGRTIGALMVTWAEAHACDDDELGFLHTLAGQTSLAVERARLLARQQSVAVTLQQAILPQHLPTGSDGVELVARYEAAETGVDVGGDWYDAFTLPDGRLALSVGDVAGHGVAAAAVMAQLRNAARAYADEDPPPGVLATKLNRLLDRAAAAGEPMLVTFIYALIDPRAGVMRWTNAGHLPPLITDGDDARLLDAVHGPPLGVDPDHTFGEDEAKLGETLLLYSDGLVEQRHRSLGQGLDQLVEVAAATAGDTIERFCDELPGRVLAGGRREDDLCLLAVRLTGS